MATNLQTLANGRNAAHSTGPRTEAGKTRSSLNAATHGMTSRKVVLPHESEEEYNELRDSIISDYAPANDFEITLAIVVAETFWRRQRLYRVETAFMSQRMNAILEANPELTDGDDALCSMFTDPAESGKARLMLRYLTAAERAHKSAVAHLEKVQKARRQAELEQASAVACPGTDEIVGEHREALSGETGFVSQSPSVSASHSRDLRQNNGPDGAGNTSKAAA